MTTTPRLSIAPAAMTRRLRVARLGVIRSYALADGAALRVYTYGPDEARAIADHLIQLGYDAIVSGGDRVTVTLPEPVEEVEPEAVEEPDMIRRISTRAELIARQVAAGVTPERAAMVADARDQLQAEFTRNAPAIAAALDEPGCDCAAVPGPHPTHCDGCSAPADRCVCDARVDDDPREEPARVEASEFASSVRPAFTSPPSADLANAAAKLNETLDRDYPSTLRAEWEQRVGMPWAQYERAMSDD